MLTTSLVRAELRDVSTSGRCLAGGAFALGVAGPVARVVEAELAVQVDEVDLNAAGNGADLIYAE